MGLGRSAALALALPTPDPWLTGLHPPPGDGYRLIMRGANLTAQEMLSALASHIQVRNAAAATSAASANKPGPGAGTRR